jgi:benzoyl-CoA 2,3-dioxygenase component B
MFVGESGLMRIVERTCQAMKAAGIDDANDVEAVRALGVIDLPMIQRKINLHYTLTLDLFGNEISTNAANAFNASIKGRYREDKLGDDHRLLSATYPVLRLVDGAVTRQEVPSLSALNMRLRDDFSDDCAGGLGRWNKVIATEGVDYALKLPHVAFNRRIGEFARAHVDPDGGLLTAEQWTARQDEFLPTSDDAVYLDSLMQPVVEPGKFAGWIAPPKTGIDSKPGHFEYVKIHE